MSSRGKRYAELTEVEVEFRELGQSPQMRKPRVGDAGAVLLAKLAMVELAGGFGYNDADASFTGPGKTPWNTAFWSGGSSSGSGAAVAAGLAAFAIGSETSGSILFPATSCGVTGLRPTYGRVSRHGAMALCWTLDKLGPMTRSAADAELVLRAIAGADPSDETAVARPFATVRGRRARIGILAKSTQKTMPAVKANFEKSLAVLAGFCDLVPDVALPDHPYDAAVDYIDTQRQRRQMIASFEQAFGRYDAIVSPTLSTVAYPIGVPFDKTYPKYPGVVSLISPGNLTGVPALGFPNGFGDNGLPTGIALLGRPFCEAKLTQIARGYQARTDFHRKRPPAPVVTNEAR